MNPQNDASPPPREPSAPPQDDLLLHSMSNFQSILGHIFENLRPESLCEIGIEGGAATRFLLDYCCQNSVRYTGIDPEVPDSSRDPILEADQEFIAKPSLEVLDELPLFDVYLIDGDHNYYTVYNELRIILSRAKSATRQPLIFLHDVSWPCARRDTYYQPDRIPPEHRHEYSFEKGLMIGNPGLVDGGFNGCGSFAVALREGGAQNGVLTAVEDILQEHEGQFKYLSIPAIFGFGILYSPSSLGSREILFFSQLEEYLDRTFDLFSILERNRVILYLKVLDFQNQLLKQGAYIDMTAETLAERHEQLDAAEVERQRLAQEIVKQIAIIEDMAATISRQTGASQEQIGIINEQAGIISEQAGIIKAQTDRTQKEVQVIEEQKNSILELVEANAKEVAISACLHHDCWRQMDIINHLAVELAALKSSEAYRVTRPVRHSLDQIRKALTALKTHLRERPLRKFAAQAIQINQLSQVLPHIASHDTITFDIFDTLLRRNIDPPDYIKRRSAKFAEILLGRQGFPLTTALFLDTRNKAEAALRSEALHRGEDHECGLTDIIRRALAMLLGQAVSEETVRDIVRYEIETEKQHLYLMPEAKETLEEIKRQGKRIVLISDMYLEKTHLEDILSHLGILSLIDDLYVSSDCRIGKYSGRLIDHVLSELDLSPGQVLHVGDNRHSDVIKPIEMGLSAAYLQNPKEQKRRRALANLVTRANEGDAGSLMSEFLERDAAQEPHQSSFESEPEKSLYEIGYHRLGPSFCAFMLHVMEDSQRIGIDDLYFVAREGYIFEKIHEIFSARITRFRSLPSIRTHYLYTSRLSTSLPSVSEFGNREILLGYWRLNPEGLRSVLECFGLKIEDFADLIEKQGIENPLENVADPLSHAPYRDLFSNPEFKKRVAAYRDPARESLRQYLAQENFFGKNGRKALVDIGWNGTIQSNFYLAFGQDPDFPILHGYYFGRHYSPYHDYSPNPRNIYFPGVVYDQNRPNPDEESINHFIPLFEMSAGGNHGSALGYERCGDETRPVLKDYEQPSEIALLQKGILDYARAFAESYDMHELDVAQLNKVFSRNLANFLLRPTRQQAQAVASMVHDEDWGTDDRSRLVSAGLPLASLLSPSELRAALDRSVWKEGTLRATGIPCVFQLHAITKKLRSSVQKLTGRKT